MSCSDTWDRGDKLPSLSIAGTVLPINKKLTEDARSGAKDSFDNQVLQILRRQAGRNGSVEYGEEKKK
jgi:hypothetical protein